MHDKGKNQHLNDWGWLYYTPVRVRRLWLHCRKMQGKEYQAKEGDHLKQKRLSIRESVRRLARQYLLQHFEGADNREAKHIYYNSLQELEMRVINMVTSSSSVDASS
jgi:DNA-binding protein Fis